MGLEAIHNMSLHVAGWADLERHLMIDEVLQEFGILVQRGAMAYSVRSTEKQRLPDGIRAPLFTCMNRQVHKLIAGIVERVQMMLGRISSFASRQIKPHHTFLPIGHREFGLPQRRARIPIPQSAHDHAAPDPEVAPGPSESVKNGGI